MCVYSWWWPCGWQMPDLYDAQNLVMPLPYSFPWGGEGGKGGVGWVQLEVTNA